MWKRRRLHAKLRYEGGAMSRASLALLVLLEGYIVNVELQEKLPSVSREDVQYSLR